MKFSDYVLMKEWNLWQDFIVKWALQPHKLPYLLIAGALGTTLGAGVGAVKGLGKTVSKLDPLAIPKEVGKGMARWGTGMATDWKYTPTWAESVEDFLPNDVKVMWDNLITMAEKYNKDKDNHEQLMDYSKLFMDKIANLPQEVKEKLTQELAKGK
jgi:cation transport regulator ChaB